MRNKDGLSRSGEFLKANPSQAPKLHHMRIMPHSDGVKVTHHGSADGKSFADHHFSHGDGQGLMSHIAENTGFDHSGADNDGTAPPNQEDEV